MPITISDRRLPRLISGCLATILKRKTTAN
jgi:hypothetical protein